MLELKVSQPNRKYEGIVIMHPDASEEDQKTLFRKNSEIIKSFSGETHHLDTWGKRRLANPIKRLKMGVYFHTTFEAGGDCIRELERTMRINDKVLRFLHSRLDDRQSLSKHLERYRGIISESVKREQEREAKAQARRAAQSKRGGPGGGGRDGAPRERS